MALSSEEKMRRNETLSNLKITSYKDNEDYVFVSYKSDDWEAVFQEIVCPLAEQHGLRVYSDKAFDSDNKNWVEQMKLNIESRNCRAVLVFLSTSYLSSYATMIELMYNRFNINVQHSQKYPPVIPISLDDYGQWDDFFRGGNNRITGMPGEGFERETFVELCDAINDYIEECNGVGISKGLHRLMKQVEKEKGLSFDVHQLFSYYMIQEMLAISGGTQINDWYSVKDFPALKSTIQSVGESVDSNGNVVFSVFDSSIEEKNKHLIQEKQPTQPTQPQPIQAQPTQTQSTQTQPTQTQPTQTQPTQTQATQTQPTQTQPTQTQPTQPTQQTSPPKTSAATIERPVKTFSQTAPRPNPTQQAPNGVQQLSYDPEEGTENYRRAYATATYGTTPEEMREKYLTQEEIELTVGENSKYYTNEFAKVLEKKKNFNFAACLFPVAFCAYRKVFLLILAYLFFYEMVSAVGELTSSFAQLMMLTGLHLYMGYSFNSLYYKFLVSQRNRSLQQSPELQIPTLRKKTGISMILGCICSILAIQQAYAYVSLLTTVF